MALAARLKPCPDEGNKQVPRWAQDDNVSAGVLNSPILKSLAVGCLPTRVPTLLIGNVIA
jgi:hypothetical protein